MPSETAPSSASPLPSAGSYARFSDGRTAGGRDASASLGVSGLEVTVASPHARYVWPYASLKAGEPLRSHAVDVLLSSPVTPGATLFVPGSAFAAALRGHAPHLTASAERWRHARPWVLGATIICGLIALIYAAGWSPIRSIAGILPESWRQRLGDQAVGSMTEGHKICSASDGVAAMVKLSTRLSKAAGTGKPFKVVVYDWSLMNAFAVPGGQVVMTKGLIDKAQSADEVAGVLAHEMGHGIELHPETGIIRAIGLAAAVELMMGGSGGALANIGLLLAQLGYTRVAEHEADLQALQLLKGAGISVQGLGDFFKRVEKIEDEDGFGKAMKQFDLLRTHPPTAERAELVRRQGSYPATPALDEASWRDLKAICTVTTAPDPSTPDAPAP
jgi:beta-barrel assembly-enhancing protease